MRLRGSGGAKDLLLLVLVSQHLQGLRRPTLKDVARWVAGEELLAVVPPCECVERCFGNQLVPLLNLTPQTLDRYTVLGLRA